MDNPYYIFLQKVVPVFMQTLEKLGKDWSHSDDVPINIGVGKKIADMVIKYMGYPQVVVEFKPEKRRFNDLQRIMAEILQAPYYLWCTDTEFALLKTIDKDVNPRWKSLTDNNLYKALRGKDKDVKKVDVSMTDVVENWIEYLISQNPRIDNYNDVIEFMESLKTTPEVLSNGINSVSLNSKAEDELFLKMLGEYNKTDLCRFTSFNSIVRTCNEASQSMVCLLCMNDKSEINYAAKHIRGYQPNFDEINRCYILSCCDIDRANDFTMLRLYANDASGCCIEYKRLSQTEDVPTDEKALWDRFKLAKVSYADDENQNHPELDFINHIITTQIGGKGFILNNISIWLHFFKPYEYREEKEVRLLFSEPNPQKDDPGKEIVNSNFKKKWIHEGTFGIVSPLVTFDVTRDKNRFPLVITKITLGPKTKEAEINKEELPCLASANKIKTLTSGPLVELSKVEHYR